MTSGSARRDDARCLFSIEQECQTTLEGTGARGPVSEALFRFLDVLGRLAPSLPGGAGLYNPYGRVYIDVNEHLELSAPECDSPYALAQVVETQHGLVAQAVEQLSSVGFDLMLVNNNHSGLLRPETAFWGTHENYLIQRPAEELAELTLPFLVTRLYAGAGGVRYPSADFLAGTRPLAMQLATGGQTTGHRAIYSTCRQEHHMGPAPRRFRLHLIVGDGHRSQFNLSLQLGATALALKAIQTDPALGSRLRGVSLQNGGEGWVETLHRLNKLASPGELPRVHPSVVEVQRIYLEAAQAWVAAAAAPDGWMSSVLQEWGMTLEAYERSDLAWLAPRLDAFTKYELFSDFLAEQGTSWRDVVGDVTALSALALLDHDYHCISGPQSAFADLDGSGLLCQRVAEPIAAGSEDEPYVPALGTRARARARFIREHDGRSDLHMTWDRVVELPDERTWTLFDPFAEAYVE